MQNQILLGIRLTWPADWVGIFEREAPIIMEIGFGNGQFLISLAKKNPEANVIGVEISMPSLRKAGKKLARNGIKNVRLVQGSAQFALWALSDFESIEKLTINFPDPWPKAAHHHRRLINERFLHLAATRLCAGGSLDIATDHLEYAEWITDCLERSPYFHRRYDTPFISDGDGRLQTKYEQKAVASGRTCYYFKWRRDELPVVNDFSIPQEIGMPYAMLQLPLDLDQIGQHFESQQYSTGKIAVRMIDLYRSTMHDTLLLDTYIAEEPLEQRVMLAITRRQSGQYLIHLHETGFPRSTTGAHYAIQCLASWLCSLHGSACIVGENLKGYR